MPSQKHAKQWIPNAPHNFLNLRVIFYIDTYCLVLVPNKSRPISPGSQNVKQYAARSDSSEFPKRGKGGSQVFSDPRYPTTTGSMLSPEPRLSNVSPSERRRCLARILQKSMSLCADPSWLKIQHDSSAMFRKCSQTQGC